MDMVIVGIFLAAVFAGGMVVGWAKGELSGRNEGYAAGWEDALAEEVVYRIDMPHK